MDSGVGITPENNGEIVRLGIPQPTGEVGTISMQAQSCEGRVYLKNGIQQLYESNDALRLRHFRYFQRPLRIFPCISGFDPWHLDLYFPGTSCFKPDDLKKTFCSQLPI